MFINSLFSFHVTFCLRFIKRRNDIAGWTLRDVDVFAYGLGASHAKYD